MKGRLGPLQTLCMFESKRNNVATGFHYSIRFYLVLIIKRVFFLGIIIHVFIYGERNNLFFLLSCFHAAFSVK
jgi:hypothetical protein